MRMATNRRGVPPARSLWMTLKLSGRGFSAAAAESVRRERLRARTRSVMEGRVALRVEGVDCSRIGRQLEEARNLERVALDDRSAPISPTSLTPLDAWRRHKTCDPVPARPPSAEPSRPPARNRAPSRRAVRSSIEPARASPGGAERAHRRRRWHRASATAPPPSDTPPCAAHRGGRT